MCSCLSGVMVMENKNAYIQPLCFGELLLFPSMEQFECWGKNEKGKHMSLSFSKLQWWRLQGSEMSCLFACCLAFLRLPWLWLLVSVCAFVTLLLFLIYHQYNFIAQMYLCRYCKGRISSRQPKKKVRGKEVQSRKQRVHINTNQRDASFHLVPHYTTPQTVWLRLLLCAVVVDFMVPLTLHQCQSTYKPFDHK